MALTTQHARQTVETYIRAWESQDPDLIVTIFTEAATYHERVLGDPIWGREAIRGYWESKVVKGQSDIEVGLLSLYRDGGTVICEWDATFDSLTDNGTWERKHMRECALLVFDGLKICSIREYWKSEIV